MVKFQGTLISLQKGICTILTAGKSYDFHMPHRASDVTNQLETAIEKTDSRLK